LNKATNGGSLYVQAKIFHAKEFLMQDFNPKLNKSKHDNPEPQAPEKKPGEKKRK
jgi:hypothetical protein